MKVVNIQKTGLRQVLNAAAETMQKGGIIAYPTETFYGLGAQFDLEKPVETIFLLKHRYFNNPLPLIIGSQNLLTLIADPPNELALRLIQKFWPGPLTLLLPAKQGLPVLITGDSGKVGVRIPGKSFALELAQHANFPITSTSANISGKPPAQDAEAVHRYFADSIDLIIDGGTTSGGNPSTIVDACSATLRIVREGAIRSDEINRAVR